MDHTSTSENSSKYRLSITNEKVKKKKQLPGKLGLDLIMQFARVYHVEQSLPAELSGFVLN